MATLDIIVKPKLKFSLKKCGDVVPYGITPEEKAKLAGIEENANNYTHPETHPASILDVVDVVNGSANKFFNERGEMVAVATSSIGVTGSQLYASTANSDVAGYKSLIGTPQPLETEILLTAKSSDGIVWGAKYLSAPFTEAVTIPTTAYGFDYWRKVSAANGTSRKHLRVFIYRAGVETNISAPLASPDIDEAEFTERQISYIFPELVLLAGDRIGIQEGFSTTHANNITLTYIVGDGRGWFMRLPLPLKHENLTDKNKEATFQHLDTTQSKTTPIDADSVGLWDSVTNVFKRTTWANIKATLKTYFDTLYEKVTNKQNSLAADGTGAKFPTVDAVNEGLQHKLVSGSNIKTVNGQSLLGSGDLDPKLAYEYTVSGNKEVVVENIDYATNTITATKHGLANGDLVNAVINPGLLEYAFSVLPFIQLNGVYVISASANTFQISLTVGGAVLTLNNTITDFSKFKIQKVGLSSITFTEIVGIEKGFRCVINGRNLSGGTKAYYYIGYNTAQSENNKYLRSANSDLATATFGYMNVLAGIQATQYFNYEFTLINSANGIGITTKTISFESNSANSYNIKNKYGCAYLNQQQQTNLDQIYIGNIAPTNGTTIKIYRL